MSNELLSVKKPVNASNKKNKNILHITIRKLIAAKFP